MKTPQFTKDEKNRPILDNYQANFRFFKTFPSDESLLTIRANSHNNLEAYQELGKFDALIRAISWSYGVEPNSFKEEPVLQFNSIECGNKFLNGAFKLLKKHKFKGYISSSVLGMEFYKHLPAGFIEIRIDKKFYHYTFNLSKITFKYFDFQPIYNKFKQPKKDLYNYNFETGKIELNKNCSTLAKY